MSRQQSAPVPSDVSASLRAARAERSLSREKAAAIAGISTSLWTQIESGVQYKPQGRVQASTTVDTLNAMARAVGLDPAELITRAGLVPPAPVLTAPPRVTTLVDLTGLPEADLHNVAAYVAGLRAARNRPQ